MTTQIAGVGERLQAYRPAVMWVLAGLIGLFLLYLVAGRVERMIERWPQASQAGVSPTHCAEFIELAKANYGEVWKSRLDPSDTTCAAEIQQAWEQQRISRKAAADLAAQSAAPETTPAPLAPPPSAEATTRARAETYCLNVISLAKAKHGADWISSLDPAERDACVRPQ
ncbi:MAG: hypothetical protein SGI91_12885 [Alphaproteobacteria bacterium]|jgi:hypothetical protein|nr:hypothetical protein [Alphaproteobacteria bacterium]